MFKVKKIFKIGIICIKVIICFLWVVLPKVLAVRCTFKSSPKCLVWGYLADKFGKKKLLLFSSSGIAVFTFLFAFSRSFTWALVTRLLQGAAMGVVVLTKSILVDICDDTNISLAFSFLFSGYHLGQVIGPSLSAVLVFLGDRYPKTFNKESFFAEYAIFLPNLLITIGFVFGIVWGYFTIPSDNQIFKPEKICLINDDAYNDTKTCQDYFMNLSLDPSNNNNDNSNSNNNNMSEKSPLLVKCKKSLFRRFIYRLKYSAIGRILRSKESFLCVILYGLYGIVTTGFYEILPVFLATSEEYGGNAMTVFDIGSFILISSIFIIITQLATSKIQFWFGAKKAFIGGIFIFICMVPLLPVSGLIKKGTSRWIFLMFVQVSINAVISVCFVCLNVFLGNSVEPDLLGTINGLGMSVSCIGRALGPTIFGVSYSWSLSNVEHHRLGFPFNQYFVFFLISLCCFLNLIYVYWLIPTSLNKRKVLPDKSEVVIRLKEYVYC
nr:protein ZINC INDUCED FACILITATOR-LIKE 1 isoform X1 [Hydra vulgaris]